MLGGAVDLEGGEGMRLEPCGGWALLRAARWTLCPPTATGPPLGGGPEPWG